MGKKLIQCPNGHFYDQEQFASCPYCQGAGSSFNDSDRVTDCFTPGGNYGSGNNNFGGGDMGVTQGFMGGGYDNNPGFGSAPSDVNKSEDITRPLNVKPQSQPSDDDRTMAYFEWNTPGKTQENKAPEVHNGHPVVGWLVCTGGSNFGKSFCLYSGKNFIGRSADMDICLQGDETISRFKHAIITYEPRARKFFAQPGESHELFYVNDNVVLTSAELNDRDEISVGQTTLVFVPFCDDRFGWEK